MMEGYVKTVADDYFLNKSFLETDFLKGAVWYKAYTEEKAVSIIQVKGEVPMILTIETPRTKELLQPNLVMAETILLEKAVVNKPSTNEEPVNEVRTETGEIHIDKEGMTSSFLGYLYKSSEQPFSIYLLENYEGKVQLKNHGKT